MSSIAYDTRREVSVTEIDTRGRVRESKKKKTEKRVRARGCCERECACAAVWLCTCDE